MGAVGEHRAPVAAAPLPLGFAVGAAPFADLLGRGDARERPEAGLEAGHAAATGFLQGLGLVPRVDGPHLRLCPCRAGGARFPNPSLAFALEDAEVMDDGVHVTDEGQVHQGRRTKNQGPLFDVAVEVDLRLGHPKPVAALPPARAEGDAGDSVAGLGEAGGHDVEPLVEHGDHLRFGVEEPHHVHLPAVEELARRVEAALDQQRVEGTTHGEVQPPEELAEVVPGDGEGDVVVAADPHRVVQLHPAFLGGDGQAPEPDAVHLGVPPPEEVLAQDAPPRRGIGRAPRHDARMAHARAISRAVPRPVGPSAGTSAPFRHVNARHPPAAAGRELVPRLSDS